ncbi:MAG: hypothetical protein C4329_14795, partial [Chitinophagaceae bacterium]
YPYSKLYKAGIRGAKKEWLEITNEVERGELDSFNGLKQILVFLNNKSEAFEVLTTQALKTLGVFLKQNPSFENCITAITNFIDNSTYSA